MFPGAHLHALAWTAGALLWVWLCGRAIADSARGRDGRAPRGARLLPLAAAAATWVGARVHFLLAAPEAIGDSLRGGRVIDLVAGTGLRIGGGLVLGAAVLAALAPTATVGRLSRLATLDRAAPLAGVAVALGRVGCWADGCCFGLPCPYAWCVVFPPGSPAYWSQIARGLIPDRAPHALPVHPLQLHLGIAALLATLLARAVSQRSPADGVPLATFVAIMAASRLLLERLRETAFGLAVPAQTELDVLLLAGSVVFLRGRRQRRAGDGPPTNDESVPSRPGIPTA